MLVSALAPFIFLTRHGRTQIGLTKTKKYGWLLLAFISGLVFSLLLYYVGLALYGSTYGNWYNYIGRSYKIPAGINEHNKAILFTVVAFTGMIFSPVGEELFFRGIVHAAFEKSMGHKKAAIADSTAFALTHISHFGLVFINQRWNFLLIPTLIWVIEMFLASVLFFIFKTKSHSILGAIICHAAFNLGMTYCIFYML